MIDVRQSGVGESGGYPADVIGLDLARAVDLFEKPQVELGSSHGTFQPGIEPCIAELQSRPTGRPLRLVLTLPQSEISDGSKSASRSPCAATATSGHTSTSAAGGRRNAAACVLCESACPSLSSDSRSPRSRSTRATATIRKPRSSTSSGGCSPGWDSGSPSTSSSSMRATTRARTARWKCCATRRSPSSPVQSSARKKLLPPRSDRIPAASRMRRASNQ